LLRVGVHLLRREKKEAMERKREKTKAEGFRKGNGVCGGRQAAFSQ
jgi:hypothetical protein